MFREHGAQQTRLDTTIFFAAVRRLVRYARQPCGTVEVLVGIDNTKLQRAGSHDGQR